MIIIIGTKFICSKLSETIPIIKPNKLNDTQDNSSIHNIKIGNLISRSTKNVEVIKISNPRQNDLVAEAPT